LSEVIEYLKFLQDIGIEELPLMKSYSAYSSATNGKQATDVETAFKLMKKEVENCNKCQLGKLRTNAVFGEGNRNTDLMFIGEGPGFDEDRTGLPFVGKAGELLTKIINAIGLSRDDVFIANIIKCRPPGNRDPLPEEIESCRPFIDKQIELIKPKVICTLGRYSTQTLLNTTQGITKIRGQFANFNGIKVMPTYHPAYLLRNPSAKKDVWQDVQAIRDYLKENSNIYELTNYGKN
jgi:DNA polymerase